MQAHESFLDQLTAQSKDLDRLEKDLKVFEKEKQAFEKKLLDFPLSALIAHWLKQQDSSEESTHSFSILVEEKIIQGLNGKLKSFVKLDLSQVYDQIRSLEKYPALEKEKLCDVFRGFLSYIETLLMGSAQFPKDPIQLLTKNKKVSHTQFLQFIKPLSQRDQLIAKVLYYGEPTLEEALEITQDKILQKQSAIQFRKEKVAYPKHVFNELKSMTKSKPKSDLVFTNQKGKHIERSHLNNCFERATLRLGIKSRITPKDLLERALPNIDSQK